MKQTIKRILRKFLLVPPASAMSIDNTYAWFDVLVHTRYIDGPVVEIGCAAGGTTALSCKLLSRIGCRKPYYCFDTFAGFVPSQLETDHKLGLTNKHDTMFKNNSVLQFRESLAKWGIRSNVNIVKGDICEVGEMGLPQGISACLLDVDLRDPIYEALKMLVPRMSPGGVIVVDDCKEGTSWVGADVGYTDFMKEKGLNPSYYMGFGIVRIPGGDDRDLPWQCSNKPNPVPDHFYG